MSRAPQGYVRYLLSGMEMVAAETHADAVRRALAQDHLYRYAEQHPKRRVFHGRDRAFGAPLPDSGARVVVRHSRHGGMLAPLTGDLFLPPTRAPHELETSLRLAHADVPTPEMIAYVVYRAGIFRRADIATLEVPASRDLAQALGEAGDEAARRRALGLAAALLRQLTAAGARHPDLNVKNILIAGDAVPRALVLDVDRVSFERPNDPSVAEANYRRLARSLTKWRERHGLAVTQADVDWLGEAARGHDVPHADEPHAPDGATT
jgi:hypothetical protein